MTASARRRVVAVVGVALAAVFAHEGDADAPAPEPAPFTGTVNEFYEAPDPLPEGEPGELIRVQRVTADDDTTTVRIMYHSRDGRDRDRAVTGIVTYPNAPAPDGDWPVVSWAHGMAGLIWSCAPSRANEPAPDFGVEGVRVATDYIGLGPVGEHHPYLSGPSEAHSVIDAVRAARRLSDAHAGSRWVAAGHSQGGHAALFTNQLGEAYAPELDLLGTVAIAPASGLGERYGPDDQVMPHIIEVMALHGLEAEIPGIEVDDYLTPEAAELDDVVDTRCAGDALRTLPAIPVDDFYDRDPVETEPARSAMRANEPGQVAVDAPLLLTHGSQDGWIVPARVEALFERLCDVGQVTDYAEFASTNHELSPAMSARVNAWIADRFAGEPVTGDCPGA